MSDAAASSDNRIHHRLRRRLERLGSRAQSWLNPLDEKIHQRRRRRLVGLFSLTLLLLSILLELNSRGIGLGQAFDALWRYIVAIFDSEATSPHIDPIALLKGFVAVGRNLLPAVLAFWFALWLGEHFVNAVYGMADRQAARQYLRDSLFGAVIGPRPHLAKVFTTAGLEVVLGNLIPARPFVIVNEGKILGGQQQPTVQIGGPASLVVRNNSAVLLERNGRLNRVLGPGFYRLRRFEKVRTIVDLRPRRTHYTVNGMSREGIPVLWTLDIDYQINDSGKGRHGATPQNPFPFSEEAVMKAATHQWIADSDSADPSWRDQLAFAAAEPELRRIIAQHTLIQLLEPGMSITDFIAAHYTEDELRIACSTLGLDYDELTSRDKTERVAEMLRRVETTAPPAGLIKTLQRQNPSVDWDEAIPPRRQIQKEVTDTLRRTAARNGMKLIDVALGNLAFSDHVMDQWYEKWKRKWAAERRKRLAQEEAKRVTLIEKAKADAKRQFIDGFTRAFVELAVQEAIPPNAVIMRFIETLRHFGAPTWGYPATEVPDHALASLRNLEQLLAGDE